MQSSPKHNIDKIRILLIVGAICSLTLSLATRFSMPPASRSQTVKSFDSRSAEPKRQNLDRDAARLVGPVQASEFFRPKVIGAHVVDVQPLFSTSILPSSLSNRPPPAFI
jgi:hypothetical protein